MLMLLYQEQNVHDVFYLSSNNHCFFYLIDYQELAYKPCKIKPNLFDDSYLTLKNRYSGMEKSAYETDKYFCS